MHKINRQVTHDNIIPCVDDQYSFIRLFHSRPDMPSVDVYVDGALRFRNIPYLGLSYYIPSRVATRNIQVYEYGTKNLLLEVPEFEITGGQIFTFTIDRVGENLEVLAIRDDINEKVYPDETKVRFVNLTGEELTVDMTYIRGGIPKIIEIIPPANVSNYVKTREGSYTIQAGTNKPGAYNPRARIALPIGKLTTIYIVGSLDPTSKLFQEGGSAQFVIIVDGNTAFTICK